jgi:hypothetical protein
VPRPAARAAAVAAAVLAGLALTGCAAQPEPDPEAFWTELSFYTDLPDDYRAQSLDRAQGVCTLLAGAQPHNGSGADSLAAAWQEWVQEMGPDDAGFFWRTAVEHLCPDQEQTLEGVQAIDDSAA